MLETIFPKEHVGEIERLIRTIKERVRATAHGLLFDRFPKLMIQEMVTFAVQCLNLLPADDGLSSDLSPHTFITGRSNPDYNNMRIEFGAYAQVYEPGDLTINNLRSRTTGAIELSGTGNAQGHTHFISLASGKRIIRGQWSDLPMPDDAIIRVEELARLECQPTLRSSSLLFEWAPEDPMDDDDDPDYVYPGQEEDEDLIYDDTEDDISVTNPATTQDDNPVGSHERRFMNSPYSTMSVNYTQSVKSGKSDSNDDDDDINNSLTLDEQVDTSDDEEKTVISDHNNESQHTPDPHELLTEIEPTNIKGHTIYFPHETELMPTD
jgi:hypothetical protein